MIFSLSSIPIGVQLGAISGATLGSYFGAHKPSIPCSEENKCSIGSNGYEFCENHKNGPTLKNRAVRWVKFVVLSTLIGAVAAHGFKILAPIALEATLRCVTPQVLIAGGVICALFTAAALGFRHSK